MIRRTPLNWVAPRTATVVAACCCLVTPSLGRLQAADLIVELTNASKVTLVGAVRRWDADGNRRRPVNSKAKIELPEVDAVAVRTRPNTWKFTDLAPDRYDLVILLRDRIRIEGFGFPPVREFDPFLAHTDEALLADRQWITAYIAKSTYYENKVTPLAFAGRDTQTRLLVQLLRDKPTSFDATFGEPVATLRHEVWQFDHRYGAWSKEKRTRVLDRVLLVKRELRQWTWIWEPRLGDLHAGTEAKTVRYAVPSSFPPTKHAGLRPY